jgi:hypothetical protein
MRKDEIYVCSDCGLELKVVQQCRDTGKEGQTCGCEDDREPCAISCCGKELIRKRV